MMREIKSSGINWSDPPPPPFPVSPLPPQQQPDRELPSTVPAPPQLTWPAPLRDHQNPSPGEGAEGAEVTVYSITTTRLVLTERTYGLFSVVDRVHPPHFLQTQHTHLVAACPVANEHICWNDMYTTLGVLP